MRELDGNSHMSCDRRQILNSALLLVTRYVDASQRIENRFQEPLPEDEGSPADTLAPELYYMILHGR